MNPRLVVCMFGGMLCGLTAGALAVLAGWGLLAGIALYSCVGSTALVVLALALPERPPALALWRRRPAYA